MAPALSSRSRQPQSLGSQQLPSQRLQHRERGIRRHSWNLPGFSWESQRPVINNGQPISLGVYDRANKLPYTMNYTLDLQWQPRNDLAIELGYVGNLGRHQVIPVPFNQPTIASPSQSSSSPAAHARRLTATATTSDSTALPAECAFLLRVPCVLSGQLRGRQRRPARSLHRLCGRVHLLQAQPASMPTTRYRRTSTSA